MFAAITFFAMLAHYILLIFLSGSRGKWRHFGDWDHLTLLLFSVLLYAPSPPLPQAPSTQAGQTQGDGVPCGLTDRSSPPHSSWTSPLPQQFLPSWQRNAAAAAKSGKAKALEGGEGHHPTVRGRLSLQFSVTTGLPWVAFKGPGHPSVERLGLCSSVAWGKKPGPLPSPAHSEKLGCCPCTQAHPKTLSPSILQPKEATVPQEPSQSLPPRQYQEPEWLQCIYLVLESLFLVTSKATTPAYPLLMLSFVRLSVSLSSRN